jgi:2-(1,2-epoxy-1,2-dihydrophenyl)acetyl-CoA isomerase
MTDLVLTHVDDQGVATLTLNNPEKLNAFAGDMRERVAAALDRIAADGSARALVVTGAGRAFCAGGDVKYMAEMKRRDAEFEGLRPLMEAGRIAIERIHALPIPTIAAVNGPAAGAGINLALACDLRIASEHATFGETFVRLGLHVDWGGSWFLPRQVGLAKALEMCWLGDMIDAQESLRIGLVNRVVSHEQFPGEIARLAARLAAGPATSLRWAKRTLRAALDRTLTEAIEAEFEAQIACWSSPDSTEGILAFAEKRAPRFEAPVTAARAGSRFE